MGQPMDIPYSSIKSLHVAAAVGTAGLFLLRVYAMVWRPKLLAHRFVRIVPHAIDTVLLLSGVWIAYRIGAAGIRGWLPYKLIGVVLFILLGTVALKRGRTRSVRVGAALAAIAMLVYIVSVAVTKSPWGLLATWI